MKPVNRPDRCTRNTGRKKLLDICLGNDLFGYDTKSINSKKKNKQEDYIKLKSFCIAEEIISKIRRQPREWEKNIH